MIGSTIYRLLHSLYRTYEELKPQAQSAYSAAQSARLYRTYEELKLMRNVVIESISPSLYRTYEELKQRSMDF